MEATRACQDNTPFSGTRHQTIQSGIALGVYGREKNSLAKIALSIVLFFTAFRRLSVEDLKKKKIRSRQGFIAKIVQVDSSLENGLFI